MHIILGSNSPRRRELLAGMGYEYTAVNIHADESFPPSLQGGDIPMYISRAKADAYASELHPGELLITADTIVWVDGQQLGKPADEADAARMLRMLSGKTHQVYTGVTLMQVLENGELKAKSFVDATDVSFRTITDEEIHYYISQYKPMDKAGAYGIQEWIGYIACTALHGSYFNVMGLPTEKLYEELLHGSANRSRHYPLPI